MDTRVCLLRQPQELLCAIITSAPVSNFHPSACLYWCPGMVGQDESEAGKPCTRCALIGIADADTWFTCFGRVKAAYVSIVPGIVPGGSTPVNPLLSMSLTMAFGQG